MASTQGESWGRIWIGVILTAILIGVAWMALRVMQRAGRAPAMPVISQVPAFALTNQDGRILTRDALQGSVWVADIIFTRCAGPCPQMTRRMAELQAALQAGSAVKLVTLTTDPEFDTPEVLREYAKRYGGDPKRWYFLTGNKEQLRAVAVGGLKLAAIEKAAEQRTSPEDLFIHSTLMVVVDRNGRLRMAVESLEEGWKEKVLQAVQALLDEPATQPTQAVPATPMRQGDT